MRMVAEGQEELFRELRERPDGLAVVESCLLVFINFLAFTGNLMVCWAVYRNQRLRTVTNIYVVTLAISDALMAVLCMPLSIALLATADWPFSEAVCNFQGFFCFFCAIFSLLLMTATAVNRYHRVVKPSLYRRRFKVKSTSLSIVFIALLAILCAGLLPMTKWATFNLHYGKGVCFMDFKIPQWKMGYMAFLDFFFVVVPVGIISIAYYKIFQAIKEHNRMMNTAKKRQAATLSINVEEVKVTKALFAAVLGFSLCWGPMAAVDIVEAFTALAIPRQVFSMYMYLGYGSCSINPVIYGVMNRAFRVEFLRALTFCRRKHDAVLPSSAIHTSRSTNRLVDLRASLSTVSQYNRKNVGIARRSNNSAV